MCEVRRPMLWLLGGWKETSITQCNFPPRVLGVGWEGHPFPTCPFVLSSTPTPPVLFYEVFVCSQNGDHAQECFAKSGYIQKYEVQIFNHTSMFFGYKLKTKHTHLTIFTIFFVTSGNWKPPKSLHFLLFNFFFLGKNLPIKKSLHVPHFLLAVKSLVCKHTSSNGSWGFCFSILWGNINWQESSRKFNIYWWQIFKKNLSKYWPKTKSCVEKWQNFPIKTFFSNYWQFRFFFFFPATACSWFMFIFHHGSKVCHSKKTWWWNWSCENARGS